MISITSNVQDVIDRLKAKKSNTGFDKILSQISAKIADKIRALLVSTYVSTKSFWTQEGSELDDVTGTDVSVSKQGNDYIIRIGETTPMIQLNGSNGYPNEANPYFFVEFGFGITGQNNPVSNASTKRWAYNVNNHKSAWVFKGQDGRLYWTEGAEGANAMGAVESEYAQICKEAIREVLGTK